MQCLRSAYTSSPRISQIYSSVLQNVVWPQTLNNARINMASALVSAVDSSVYYESAYDNTVSTGDDLPPSPGSWLHARPHRRMSARARTSRASRCSRPSRRTTPSCSSWGADPTLPPAPPRPLPTPPLPPPFPSPRPSGGEFKPAVRWVAPQFPSVNFLISSSLFNNLTSWGLPNVRAITGRISGARGLPAGGTSLLPHPRALLCRAEAIFYCGYVAAASSYTGKLGAPLLPPSFERPRCHRAPPLPPPRPQASSSPSTTRRPMALQTRSRSAPALPPPTA